MKKSNKKGTNRKKASNEKLAVPVPLIDETDFTGLQFYLFTDVILGFHKYLCTRSNGKITSLLCMGFYDEKCIPTHILMGDGENDCYEFLSNEDNRTLTINTITNAIEKRVAQCKYLLKDYEHVCAIVIAKPNTDEMLQIFLVNINHFLWIGANYGAFDEALSLATALDPDLFTDLAYDLLDADLLDA